MLKATSTFLHRSIANKRLFIASLAGGISSLLILLPEQLFIINIIMKVAAGMVIILISFGYGNFREYIKNSLIFIIVSMVFAGLTMLLWFFAAPLSMEYNNGYVYFGDLSFMTLLITTAAAYGVIRALRYVIDAKQVGDREYKITIVTGKKTVTLPALADSGNLLTDYFTGLSVIVCPQSAVSPPDKFRLLPYNTIDSVGLIPVFRADSITINDKSVNALIGVTDSACTRADSPRPAIFNPKLLI
jgi:stage II sporulation protein GA (sporulation sigma-E factor processing peptidase)